MTIGDFFINVLSSTAFMGLLKWGYDYFKQERGIQLKSENDEELEKLKADIVRINTLLTSSIGSMASINQTVTTKKMEALDVFWNAYLNYKRFNLPIESFYVIFVDQEYVDIIRGTGKTSFSPFATFDFAEILNSWKFGELDKSVEEKRLLLGENIWSMYNDYRVIVLRSAYLIYQSKRGKEFAPWNKDDVIKRLVKKYLSEEQIINLKSSDYGAVLMVIESTAIRYANEFLSGKEIAKTSFDQAKAIFEEHEQFIRSVGKQ